MKWKEPSNNHPFLFLPLTQGNPQCAQIDWVQSTAYKTPVTTEWLNIWNTPTLTSDTDICKTLITLIQPLIRLINLAQSSIDIHQKEQPHDLVTDADIGIELLIRLWFSKHLPSHILIGEETTKAPLSTEAPIWYLDPIDGTSNYSKNQANYCLNIGSTYNNAPYINIVILPRTGETYFSTPKTSNYTLPNTHTSALCTEFYPHRTKEASLFNELLKENQLTPHQTKAIGVSLFNMLQGHCTAFYKPFVKPWDIMTGAGILATHNFWDICFLKHNMDSHPLFANDPNFVTYLNTIYQQNCRIGHLIITPKNMPDLKNSIIDKLRNL